MALAPFPLIPEANSLVTEKDMQNIKKKKKKKLPFGIEGD